MRVVVFGYHDVGCACLRGLLDIGQEVPLVVTHADDPGETIWFGSVRELAASRGVPVMTPADANASDLVEAIRALRPDAFLSCYFRQILGPALLAIPPRGAYNMHGSLLPKFRGRAPVNWVLVKGETVTGVTLHHMTEKPDRGDIVGQRAVPITDEDTALTLHGKCAAAAGDLIREVWPRIEEGTAPRIPQDPAQASYFGRRRPEDGRIDWSLSARECFNLVRAVTHPYPGAFTTAGDRKLFVWKAKLLPEEPSRPKPAAAATAPVRSGGEAGIAADRREPGRVVLAAIGPEAARTSPQPERRDERIDGGTDWTSGAGGPCGRPGGGNGEASAGSAALREAQQAPTRPGAITSVLDGTGFMVRTGSGFLLVERAQFEGHEERSADRLVRSGGLHVGQRLGP